MHQIEIWESPISKVLVVPKNVNPIISKSKVMEKKFFVGVDVSKDTLDACLYVEGKNGYSTVVPNSPEGIAELFSRLSGVSGFTPDSAVFCMEHTGIYGNPLLASLATEGIEVRVEPGTRIRMSAGPRRSKTDALDAALIARYAWLHRGQGNTWRPCGPTVAALRVLLSARDRLVKVRKQLSTPLGESDRFSQPGHAALARQTCKATLAAMDADLSGVELRIAELLAGDPELARLEALVTSVGGIGRITAAYLIAVTDAFRTFTDPKKFACHAGVVPFAHRSGTSVHKRDRVSHMADKKAKTLLHMAALSAIRMDGEHRDYFLRKVAEGKNKMLVINAIRNKLVLRIFAVVNRGTPYLKNYAYTIG